MATGKTAGQGSGPRSWPAGEPKQPAAHRLRIRLANAQGLDSAAEPLTELAHRTVGHGTAKDALAGRWLGHPLHPMLTDVTIGTWLSATALDVIGGRGSRAASERLIGAGIAAAAPTALSGLVDYHDTAKTDTEARRVGVVHAAANTAALACYSASLAARRRGRHRAGFLLGAAGMAAMAIGGQLGGHLSFSRGVGVARTVFDRVPEEWTAVADASELADGEERQVVADGTAILLARRGERIFALADRCCHRGGPLHQGDADSDTVTCPWHGSTFGLEDGSALSGPATNPQPTYDVRVRDGRVEVKAP